MKRKEALSGTSIESYIRYLASEEKSPSTLEKYARDIRRFAEYMDGREVAKDLVIGYKEQLRRSYMPASANSMIAAINGYFSYIGRPEMRVKRIAVQKKVYCEKKHELTKSEYKRLLEASRGEGQERINLIVQTLCGTGIRVSELEYITVEAVHQGRALVDCKGKMRVVFIPQRLRRLIQGYIKRKKIGNGPVFITRGGLPMDRSNIWRDMKALCVAADVEPGKVFPHNLRHLFARSFYDLEKDIAKLADILGHSSIETTRIYILSCGTDHCRQLEKLGLVS